MALYAIGNLTFLDLAGEPVPPQPQLQTIARDGVDNVATWETGERGELFTLVSTAHFATRSAAYAAHDQYRATIRLGSLLRLVLGGVDQTIYGWQVEPHKVVPQRIARTGSAVGGAVSSGGTVLICQWSLLAILL